MIKWYGDRVKRLAREAAARGLEIWARDEVYKPSQEIVPVAAVKGGKLRGSGDWNVSEREMRATIKYTDDKAIIVHENTRYRHRGRQQAKYLETPLNASKDTGPQIVARELRKVLR